MSVLLDVIGSVLIGGMLLIMIFTFTTQLNETTQRAIYTATMIDYMDQAGTKINALIALAGIGVDENKVVEIAESDHMVFKTMWSYDNDVLTNTEHTIDLRVEEDSGDLGNVITIKQDDALISNPAYVSYIQTYVDGFKVKYYGYILYVESMSFEYFDENDDLTDEVEDIRSTEIELTFKRDAPGLVERSLRTSLKIKCFFMNSYMRMGA